MSNIATVQVTSKDYKKLEEIIKVQVPGFSFKTDTNYLIQFYNPAKVCEKASKPNSNEGMIINNTLPFLYKAGADALWVANKSSVINARVNVAE